jgi:hypothetical protein
MLLLMVIDVVVLAFIWIILNAVAASASPLAIRTALPSSPEDESTLFARGGPLFKTTVQTTVSNACISHAVASAARAASF